MLIKVIFKDILHRQHVEDTKSFTFDELLEIVRKFEGLPKEFTIQYTDDEMESVTIGSTSELNDAFAIAERDGRTALRLTVVQTNPSAPLSVITTNSTDSHVIILPSQASGEESDFGDSDFEFLDEDGEVEIRKSKTDVDPNVSVASNPVLASADIQDNEFFATTPAIAATTESVIGEIVEQVPTNPIVEQVPTNPIVEQVPTNPIVEQVEQVPTNPIVEQVEQVPTNPIVEVDAAPEVQEHPPIICIEHIPSSSIEEPVAKHQEMENDRVTEIAQQVFREVAENQMNQLTKALEIVFQQEDDSKKKMDLGSIPLALQLAKVFSNPENVSVIQEALSKPEVKEIVVDICKTKLDSGNVLDSITAHMVKYVDLVTALLKNAPEIFTLIPPLATATMRFLQEENGQDQTVTKETTTITEDMSIVHKRVQCNGCLELNPRMTNYIQGPRFKSAIVDDFDLCLNCEQNGKYRESHGPFLKIYNPAQAPEAILCVLKDGCKNKSSPQHENLNRFWKENKENVKGNVFKEIETPHDEKGRILVGSFTDMMESHIGGSCEAAEAVANKAEDAKFENFIAEQVSDTSAKAVSNVISVTTSNGCPGKHLLTRFVLPHIGYICDRCDARPAVSATMYGCRVCDFDLCESCHAGKTNMATAKVTLNASGSASSITGTHTRMVPRPQAKFVADVTFPDGSFVSPGATISKTWRLVNNGKLSWPKGSRIAHVGGDSLGLPSNIVLDEVLPGHVIDVTVQLTAPTRPGRVVGYFRLMTPDNQRFGHRFWVDLNVDGTLGERIAATVANPFFQIGQNIVSRVQEETMKLYPKVPENSVSSEVVSSSSSSLSSMRIEEAHQTNANAANTNEPTRFEMLMKKYEIELNSLSDMGFLDMHRNCELLEEHKGELEAVIVALAAL